MGDIVSLVEKAAETIDQEKAARLAKKMQKGAFDLDDLAEQLKQMSKLGGMSGIMSMMPGVGKMKKQLDAANLDDSVIKRQVAIISSMTKKERQQPKLLNASRKKRIAAGSGTQVQDVNRLLKSHRQMADMMKMMGKKKGLLGSLMGRRHAGYGSRGPRRDAEIRVDTQRPAPWNGLRSPRPWRTRRAQTAGSRRSHRIAGSARWFRQEEMNGASMTDQNEPDTALPEELLQIRKSIDNLDAALIHILAERFRCTKNVGALKARHNLPPADPAREQRQMARLRNLAKTPISTPILRKSSSISSSRK